MARKLTRREFIGIAAGGVVVAGAAIAAPAVYDMFRVRGAVPLKRGLKPDRIRKFVTRLPGLGPTGANEIGQYLPLAKKASGTFAGSAADMYDIAVGPYSQVLHPDLPGATHLLGYHDAAGKDRKYLGGVIVAKRGTPVLLNVRNNLPDSELVPIDPTVMAGEGVMTGDLPLNRTAVHLHGGFTPWFSDGTPLQWFDPKGAHGTSFMNVPGTSPAAGSATYYYPMDQSARLLWYHDHAMGITRTNAYSGIASALVLVDDFEIGLVNAGLLPDLVGIPLVIQDKGFVPLDIERVEPSWRWGAPGDLWYPHIYSPTVLPGGKDSPTGHWDWGPTSEPPSKNTKPLPEVSCVPEAFFDTILVNGAPYPVVDVKPQRMRFRLLNGSQARFYHLSLLSEDPAQPGEPAIWKPGPVMYQVGTEGGFLPASTAHDNTVRIPLDRTDTSGESVVPTGPFNLLLAPAERADVVIDFNGVAPGSTFILYNDAPAPFPGGDPRNDYFTGDRDQRDSGGAGTTAPGHGPNTRTLMKFVVGSGSGDAVDTASWRRNLDSSLRNNFLTGNQPALLFAHGKDPSQPAFPFTGTPHRVLTLNEDFDEYGRLSQTIGTAASKSTNNQGIPTWGLPYLAEATETPVAGSTEVWQIVNLTMDTHPIHFHLVNVQLIQRQAFEGAPGRIKMKGSPKRPDPNELGWKETVRMNPGEVTTVIMKFDLPSLPTTEMRSAVSPRTGGAEYVWHCHILEHEEHDMMRPLIVK